MPDNNDTVSKPDGQTPNPPVPVSPGRIPPAYVTPPAYIPGPVEVHRLTSFPLFAIIILHYLSCGIFTLVWLNLMHGSLPRVRSDDPSVGKAIGFCFIPFFNLYWIFFTFRRLCLRVDEQRNLYGLPASNLTGLATGACIVQVIPYVNLIGYAIVFPIFAGCMQASINELVAASTTTQPRGTLQTQPAGTGTPGWAIALIICGAMFGAIFVIAILSALLLPALAQAKAKAQTINCINNLKQVGLAFKIWELDHDNQFPFNVSTNAGGTLEWCLPGADGLDQNSWIHFQVLSNELSTTKILRCPDDNTRQAAVDFGQLQAGNVSYWVHSGTNVSSASPQTVIAICPIHYHVVFSDGSVQKMSEAQMRKLLSGLPEAQ